MNFSMMPDDGPPRVVRFVTDGSLGTSTVAVLDKSLNVLRVDRDFFDKLTKSEQSLVIKTRRARLAVETNSAGKIELVQPVRRIPFTRPPHLRRVKSPPTHTQEPVNEVEHCP
ncbi:MAG TPA: hypothetical protein VKT73_15330 [Xanthobacteraceae bacterium]|nr:hypothetical protein [Xanthobacteraceae bacterium]